MEGQEINLYIAIQAHGPRRRDGTYIWLLERIKENGVPDPRTLHQMGTRENTIDRDLVMEAIVEALDRVREGNEVTIILHPMYLAETIPAPWKNGWVDSWEKSGWKNAKGDEIENAVLWKKCKAALNSKNAIFGQRYAGNAYKDWMISQLKAVSNSKNAICDDSAATKPHEQRG